MIALDPHDDLWNTDEILSDKQIMPCQSTMTVEEFRKFITKHNHPRFDHKFFKKQSPKINGSMKLNKLQQQINILGAKQEIRKYKWQTVVNAYNTTCSGTQFDPRVSITEKEMTSDILLKVIRLS